MLRKRFDAICQNFKKRLVLQGVAIPEGGRLAGASKPETVLGFFDPTVAIGWDNSHFPFPYGAVLALGLPGVIERAEQMPQDIGENEAARKRAIAGVYRTLMNHIQQHAGLASRRAQECPADADRLRRIERNLRALADGPPKTFEQGVQLFWFLWRARQYAHTSCIGRMDVFLRPLYEASVTTTQQRKEALELICELWEKLNQAGSGDTLMNVMLGGVDEKGRDTSCDLSLLLMEATMRVAKSEPHMNVRLHEHTPNAFRQTAHRMIAMGQGHGVVYNDEFHIPRLVQHGVPLELARLYANDGCTELTIDAKSGLQFWQMEMMKTLELTLFRGSESPCRPHIKVHKWTHRRPAHEFVTQLKLGVDCGDPAAAADFDAFWTLFLRQLDIQLDEFFDRIDRQIIGDKETEETLVSPLVCGGFPRCLDKGIDPLRGGFEVDNYQLLSGSIPTTADCLMAVKRVIYDDRAFTMRQLLDALASNFEGSGDLRDALLSAPKFGNDDDEVDLLAARITDHFIARVDGHRSVHGVRIWPGIYNIDFHMFASALGASPDGRKAGEAICDHYSPTPGRARKGPTAILQSAAKGRLQRGCAASPVYVTLPAGNIARRDEIVSDLIDGIRRLELPLVSIVFYDKDALVNAMEHPEGHEDLIVRVWGYNARFIDLDRPLQQHIIDRILTT